MTDDEAIVAARERLVASLQQFDVDAEALVQVLDSTRRLTAVRKALAQLSDEDTLRLDAIVTETKENAAGVDHVGIVLLDEMGGHVLASAAPFAVGPRERQYCQVPVASDTLFRVVDSDRDSLVKKLFAKVGGAPAKSYLGVPIYVDEQAVGSMCMININKHEWTDEDVELLYRFAAEVSLILGSDLD